MDLDQFIHIYGKHKPRVLDSEYIMLRIGDTILPGDEVLTWLSADCNELGWLKIGKVRHHTERTERMSEVRRLDPTRVAALPAGINPLFAQQYQIEHIDRLRVEHNLLYSMMCCEGIGHTVERENLTFRQANSVIRGAVTILRKRKERTARQERVVAQAGERQRLKNLKEHEVRPKGKRWGEQIKEHHD